MRHGSRHISTRCARLLTGTTSSCHDNPVSRTVMPRRPGASPSRAPGGHRSTRLRVGVLGAAKIVPGALLKPAATNTDVEVAAIAARDPTRAAAFAAKHGIPTVYDSYASLLGDDSLDAVYIPLPNALHGRWTIAALEPGLHVLCEKPFTANAGEAQIVADAAAASGLVVMEAFHWRYHPLAARMVEIVRGGELGELRVVEGVLCFPNFRRNDIRWKLDLAGGALMDAGC